MNAEDRSLQAVAVYDDIAGEYARLYFELTTEDIPQFERFVAMLPSGARVVDLGCGPGGGTRFLSGRGLNAEGIDMSEQMLRIARERVPDGSFRKMDMRHLEYPNASIDGMVAAHSLIHITSPEIPALLKEWRRVLRPGGLLLILAIKGEGDHLEDEPMKPGAKVFLNFFDLDRLRQFVEGSGMEIVSADEVEMINIDGTVTKGLSVFARK